MPIPVMTMRLLGLAMVRISFASLCCLSCAVCLLFVTTLRARQISVVLRNNAL